MSVEGKRKSVFLRILAVCAICVLDLLCGAGYMYFINTHGGMLLSVKHASDNIRGIFTQGLITIAFPLLLFLSSLFILKNNFLDAMSLRIRGKKQIIPVALLAFVLMTMTVTCLIIKEDKVTILYNLFYYLVLIAFTEEFVVRGLCVYLLKDFSWKIRYLIPNMAFGFMHIFAYANYGNLTPDYILHFLTSSLLGLVTSGCLLQLLKEKSGTLWVPVLVHAICDYSAIFLY